ncbi:MAG TPA: EAL domain-containing protein [Actinomycetota bacterium]|nr:EAL domain-containing protein [Actinomycetota bacterium]
MTDTIRVMIADDESELRIALSDLLAHEDELELVGAAADAEEAISLALDRRPDVAILDVKMPAGGGARAAREILRASPATRVIALSAHEDRSTILEMFRAGAVGYLIKGAHGGEIVHSIIQVARGGTSLSAEVVDSLVSELSTQLRREEQASIDREDKARAIRNYVRGEARTLVFQPIVDMETGEVVGAEALSRFSDADGRTPDLVFADAAAVGMQLDLETAAIRDAVACLPGLPEDAYLSVNCSHRTAMWPGLLDLVREHAPRLVLEITEHERVEDYDALPAQLEILREAGTRLAIDDAGAGFASLRHALRLAPDIIKADMSIVRGVDGDDGRRALASALVSFAQQMGMTIIAEGIETTGERATLRSIGVRFGQGFLLGRPAPIPLPAGHATTAS